MQEYYTISEVAAILKVTTTTLYAWIKSGKLDAKRVGTRRFLVSASELKRILGE